MARLRFSLLSLILFSIVCASAMGVYRRFDAWVVERNVSVSSMRYAFEVVVASGGGFFLVASAPNQYECFAPNGDHLWGPADGDLNNTYIPFEGRWIVNDHPRLKKVSVVDAKTGKLIRTVANGIEAESFSISPDGHHLFAGSSDMEIWDLQNGERLARLGFEELPDELDFDVSERKRIQQLSLQKAKDAKDLITYARELQGPAVKYKKHDPSKRNESPIEGANEYGVFSTLRGYDCYPYAVVVAAHPSANGSRILTGFRLEKNAPEKITLWNGTTLAREGDIDIPAGCTLHAISPTGDSMLLLSPWRKELILCALPDGVEIRRFSDPNFTFDSDTAYTSDGEHIVIRLVRETQGGGFERRFKVFNLRKREEVLGGYWRLNPGNCSADFKRYLRDEAVVMDCRTREPLFDFNAKDDDSRSVVAIFPDGRRALTHDGANLELWMRNRDEGPWGIFTLWETYLLIGFGFAFLWSLFRRPSASAKTSTASADVISAA